MEILPHLGSPGFWGEVSHGSPQCPRFSSKKIAGPHFLGLLIKGILRKNHPLRLYFFLGEWHCGGVGPLDSRDSASLTFLGLNVST